MKLWRATALTAIIIISSAVWVRAVDDERRASLYQRLGGMPAVQAVVDDFVTRVLADSRINKWFAHASSTPENAAAYKAKLADFICQATGGPCTYTGPDMFTAHKGRGVTNDAFDAVVQDLVATLDKLRVPEREKSQLLGVLGPMKTAVVQQQQ